MLSEALRLLRVFHDMKQNELALELSLSKSYISEIEKNNRTPSLEVIEKYAQYFDVPASSILFFSEQLENQERHPTVMIGAKKAIASKVLKILQFVEERTERDAINQA